MNIYTVALSKVPETIVVVAAAAIFWVSLLRVFQGIDLFKQQNAKSDVFIKLALRTDNSQNGLVLHS